MAKDISEELYAKIKESFDRKYEKAQLLGEPLHDVLARIQSGAGTFRDADMYAVEVGSMISDSLKEHIKLDELPNKTFYRNIAKKTLGESLKDGYGMVSNIAAVIQEEMNEAAGIGLKAVKPKLEGKAVDKVVDGAVQAKSQEELDAALTEPVKTFTRRVVDDTQKANARLHNKAGLEVKVAREYDGVGLHNGTDVCDWCLQRAGTWTYEKAMANGVFERHEGCGCIIDYTSKKGERTRGEGRKNSEGKRTSAWEWKPETNREDRIEFSAAAGTLPNKMKAFIPPIEKRKRIIEKGINEEKAIFCNKEELLYKLAYNLPEKEGFYTVVLHGSPYSLNFQGTVIDPDTLCAIIAQRKDYKKGTDIRLISCYTGEKDDGVAQYIADKLKVNVVAPDKKGIITRTLSGEYITYSGSEKGIHDGVMRTFKYKR